MRSSVLTAVVLIACLAVPSAALSSSHSVTADQKCTSSKLKFAGKEGFSFLKCYSKAAKRNEAVDPLCVSKAQDKFALTYSKAEAKGGCLTVGDASSVESAVTAGTDAAQAALPHNGDSDSQKCASSKSKAAGKYLFSVFKCYSKSAKKAEAVDPLCLSKAAEKLSSSFAKAEAKVGCATVDDLAFLQSLMDDTYAQVEAVLTPICGNDIVNPGEHCDGTDDAACPGQCSSLCTCCGDGTASAPEECDDGNTADGDGCSALCQLENTSALCTGVPSTTGTALDAQLVASGFSDPTYVTSPRLDPNRLFVVEQEGVIHVVKNGLVLPTPALDIDSIVHTHLPVSGQFNNESGLFSMAFHPDFETNARFFVNYTNNNRDTVISRFEMTGGDPDADTADPASRLDLITVTQDFANHNGGQLQFGSDGMLYVGMGDGGSGCDPNGRSQDDTQLLGKMLRMDVDVETPPYYAVPADNPNPGAGDPLGLIWAKGLRNPYRFSFDRATDDLYIADVGQNRWEEVNVAAAGTGAGLNYGWDFYEGNECATFVGGSCDTGTPCSSVGLTFPVTEYPHPDGFSITGGYVYRGCAIPDIAGTYFYSDFVSAFVRTFQYIAGTAQNAGDVTADLADNGSSVASITSYGEDARGELYIVDRDGEIYKIVAE